MTTRRKFLSWLGLGVAAAPALPEVAKAFAESAPVARSVPSIVQVEWTPLDRPEFWTLRSPAAINDSARSLMAIYAQSRDGRFEPDDSNNTSASKTSDAVGDRTDGARV